MKTKFKKKHNEVMSKLYFKGRFDVTERYFATRMAHDLEGALIYGNKYHDSSFISLSEYLSNPKADIYPRSIRS